MEKSSSSSRAPEPLIIIGPAALTRRLRLRAHRSEVLCFEYLAELDRWRDRENRVTTDGTLLQALDDALNQLGPAWQPSSALHEMLKGALSRRTSLPSLREIVDHSTRSRRSFFRMWQEEVPESPMRFLRRVQLVHALRLAANGMSLKEAAAAAGCSVENIRRKLQERRTRPGLS